MAAAKRDFNEAFNHNDQTGQGFKAPSAPPSLGRGPSLSAGSRLSAHDGSRNPASPDAFPAAHAASLHFTGSYAYT